MNTWIFTSAFCKAKMLEECLKHLYSDPFLEIKPFCHVVIDNHYPINKEKNRERIQELCLQYRCAYIDSGCDLGLHQGLNKAMAIVGVEPDDHLLGCDPDDRPSKGWALAMTQVMTGDPSVAVCGMNFWVLPWKQNQQGAWKREIINYHRVWIHPGVEMWNVAAFNMKLVRSLGGFSQPNAYYGGIEIALYHEWVKRQMKLVYLIDYSSEAVPVNREDPELYDQIYGKWKIDHAMHGYTGSFESYLKENLP